MALVGIYTIEELSYFILKIKFPNMFAVSLLDHTDGSIGYISRTSLVITNLHRSIIIVHSSTYVFRNDPIHLDRNSKMIAQLGDDVSSTGNPIGSSPPVKASNQA